MKFFDLFAGVGGFRLAMERNGHECVGSCEWDKYARETYKKNFGDYPKYNDAKEIKPGELPNFDVLCAGFPCQAFSIAGKRKGFEDTRGTVFFEIARIAKEKRPRYLFLENVRGLLNHDKRRTFRTILSTLDDMGYDAEWQLFNSKYFVPQNRERIFIIGHLRGKRTKQIFPLGEICEVSKEIREQKYLPSLTATDSKGPSKQRINNTVVELDQIGFIKKNIQGNRVYDPNGLSPSLKAEGGGWGAKTGLFAWSSSGRSWGREHRVKTGESNTLSTGDGGKSQSSANFVYLANTNANMKQRVQNREETWTLSTSSGDFAIEDQYKIRKLTPLECERLQTFPDNWTEGVSDTQRYRQMGNAVTVSVVQYIAQHF